MGGRQVRHRTASRGKSEAAPCGGATTLLRLPADLGAFNRHYHNGGSTRKTGSHETSCDILGAPLGHETFAETRSLTSDLDEQANSVVAGPVRQHPGQWLALFNAHD